MKFDSVFRLLEKTKSLRILFKTLVIALPALANVGLLMFLIMFVYAVMGMQLFGNVMWVEGDYPDRHVNFGSFWSSFIVTVGTALWLSDCLVAPCLVLWLCCSVDYQARLLVGYLVRRRFACSRVMIGTQLCTALRHHRMAAIQIRSA